MAMASENSARGQSNSSAMGIWNTPNDARIAKEIIRMVQPAIRTGVMRGADFCMGPRTVSGADYATARRRQFGLCGGVHHAGASRRITGAMTSGVRYIGNW